MPKDVLSGIIAISLIMGLLMWLNFTTDGNYITANIPDIEKIPAEKIRCRDFPTHTDAQLFFDSRPGLKAGYKALDGDVDGEVCENLP